MDIAHAIAIGIFWLIFAYLMLSNYTGAAAIFKYGGGAITSETTALQGR